jgi:hypothetical protein
VIHRLGAIFLSLGAKKDPPSRFYFSKEDAFAQVGSKILGFQDPQPPTSLRAVIARNLSLLVPPFWTMLRGAMMLAYHSLER